MSETFEIVVQRALEDNFQYLVIREGEAVAVDPAEGGQLREAVRGRGLRLTAILVTHEHWDHVAGVEELAAATGAKVMGLGGMSGVAVDVELEGNERIELLGTEWGVLLTPGHCRVHAAYGLAEAKAVFTGDALFAGGCGRLFGNPPEWMAESLRTLGGLPEDWTVYGGHDYVKDNLAFAMSIEPGNRDLAKRVERNKAGFAPSTIGEEKRTNPFLRTGVAEVQAAVGLEGGSEVAVFAALRLRKDGWR
ncbi:MAG TPA: hydroxyacylglutathione hydrolase [Kiritimatiellia bacterium]|nr:hydroxyacylglutathione hydrolase [Kiritimatiellia bacterium]